MQFSLKMLLLVTALVASIVGWRVAVARYNQAMRQMEHSPLQNHLDLVRLWLKNEQDNPDPDAARHRQLVRYYQTEIEDDERAIAER